MHKLNKPSLFKDDDDDDISEFGKDSNKFLKTNKFEPKPKDNFQKELEIKVEQRNKKNSQPFDTNAKFADVRRKSNQGFIRENDGGPRLKDIRTPTPRSNATDSDIEEDSGAEGSLGMSGSNMKGIGDSGWHPGVKKSPRASVREDDRHTNKDLANQRPLFDRDSLYGGKSAQDVKILGSSNNFYKWNKSSENNENKRLSGIYDDEDVNSKFGKSNTNFMKSPRDSTSKADKYDSIINKQKVTKSKLEEDDEEESYHDKSSSSRFMKSTKHPDPNQKSEFSIHSNQINNKFNLEPYDDKEMSSSSKFMKTMKVTDQKEKSDFSVHSKPRNNKMNFIEDEEDSFPNKSSASKFMKTTKHFNEKEDVSMKSNPRNSQFNFTTDGNDEDSFQDKSSKFNKTNFHNKNEKEKQGLSFQSKPRNNQLDFSLEENQEDSYAENSSSLMKTIKISYDNERNETNSRNSNLKSHKNDEDTINDKSSQFLKTSKESNLKINEKQNFLKQLKSANTKYPFGDENDDKDNFLDKHWNSESMKSKGPNILDNKDKHKDTQGFFPIPHKRESKSMFDQNEKEDKIPKFLKDDYKEPSKYDSKTNSQYEKNKEKNPMKNSRLNEHENEFDFKRRSIRFEDEDNDKSEKSSRHNSPHKDNRVKSNSKKSRSPSPVTSICEEYEKDPVQQRLEEIKQRRQDRKKQENSINMNTEHRIAAEAIYTISMHQGKPDIPTSSTKKVIIPLNKKYQNIQSKITTKPNMKSVSMTNLNDIWSKIEEPNTDRTFSASHAIRETAYLEWYKNKLKELQEKKKDAPVEAQEPTKEKRNEDDVKATYEAWLSKKKEYFLEMKRKKEEQQKKQTENKENKDSKNSTFDLWKKMKDESKKKETEKHKEEIKKVERQKNKETEEKKEELRKKKSEWEIRQMKELKMKKEKEDEEKRKEQEKKDKADDKQMQAEMSYKMWEEKMEENQRVHAAFDKKKEILVQNRRAWRPSSNTVTNTR